MFDPQRYGAMVATPTPPRGVAPWRWTLAAALLAGAGGCSSSPQYPINIGERPGDGSIIATQPRYPISARDAAQNAADRASQNGYPAYGAPPLAAPQSQAYGPPPAAAPPPSDDPAADAPRPHPDSAVDSADLPPPAPAPPADVPPPPPPGPQAIRFDGARLVIGMDSVETPVLEFAAYRHKRHRAAAAAAVPAETVAAAPAPHGRRHHGHAARIEAAKAEAAKASASEGATAQADASTPAQASAPDASVQPASVPRHGRRRHGRVAEREAADTPVLSASAPTADTPYQTVVRPGETLAQVAARAHSSREALTALNALKHPRHVKAGTVLKIPYRYSYEVQKGDTLYTISRRFDQDPDAMARLNGLKHAAALQPGQTITLPTTAEDTGKRDHATAEASPVAAPEKLADAALRKLERHNRHRHGEPVGSSTLDTQLATAESAPATRHRPTEAAPAQEVASDARTTPPGSVAEASPSIPTPRPVAPAPSAVVPSATGEGSPPTPTSAPGVGTQRYAGVRPTPAPGASGVIAGYGYRPAEVPSASTYHAPSTAPAYAQSTRTPVIAAPAPSYAPPRYGPSFANRPGTGAQGDARVATLAPPRYATTLPQPGGYAPSLGRERAVTPAIPGGSLSPGDVASAGRGRFIWPLRGQVISSFGDKGTGQHNDGVDIAALPGTGVRAAAAGEVVYAGSSIPGFGNLVLVKHAGGWVTAYAHLDRIEVRMRSTVAQGEEIGQAGQTGAVDRPQLHFEVRYAPDPAEKARPVDPTLVLPAG